MNIKQISAGIIALMAWVTLGIVYYVTAKQMPEAGFLAIIINVFSFFTMISTALIAIVMSFAALTNTGFANTSGWRAAVAVYTAIVSLVYHLVISQTLQFEGLNAVANLGYHTVLPIAYLVDWVLFAPKAGIRARDPLKWAAFPAVYCIASVIWGSISGWYPYFFLDPSVLGYTRVILNIAGITAIFYFAGLAVFLLTKTRSSRL